MKSVLVTGGTGFFGSWLRRKQPEDLLCLYLGRADYEVGEWRAYQFDYIIHAAKIAPTEILEKARKDDSRIMYVSSGAVYHPENNTEYRRNKIKWECECLDSGLDVVIARPFAFMDSSDSWVTFFRAAREKKPLEVWGDGSTTRSYMHGSELARWLWAILLHGECGEAYDVGSDRAITMLQLAKRIRAFTGAGIEFVDKPIFVSTYLPEDTAKTRKLLDRGKP